MAPKPAARHRMTGTLPVIPPRGPFRPRTSAFPLLPAAAATLLLLGVGQAALWWYGGRMPGVPEYTRLTHVFSSAAVATPTTPRGFIPQHRLETPPLEQNIQFGDAMGRVRVTIFTDPACGSCRARAAELTAALPVQGVRQVYKFWPADSHRTTPGLLMELARREAIVASFWKLLQAQKDRDLSDIELLQLLEQAGLPLERQRAAFSQNSADLYGALVPDMALARNAGLPPPPVIVIDNQIMDSARLTPQGLADAVSKKLEGRQLAREDQLWMMNR